MLKPELVPAQTWTRDKNVTHEQATIFCFFFTFLFRFGEISLLLLFLSLSLSLIHTHTLFLSLSLSLFYTRTHSLSLRTYWHIRFLSRWFSNVLWCFFRFRWTMIWSCLHQFLKCAGIKYVCYFHNASVGTPAFPHRLHRKMLVIFSSWNWAMTFSLTTYQKGQEKWFKYDTKL